MKKNSRVTKNIFFCRKIARGKKIPFYWCLDDQNRLKTVETGTFGLKNLFLQKFVFLVHTVYKEKIWLFFWAMKQLVLGGFWAGMTIWSPAIMLRTRACKLLSQMLPGWTHLMKMNSRVTKNIFFSRKVAREKKYLSIGVWMIKIG